MFDYTLVHWVTFLSAAILLNLSPGPDIAYILGQTLRGGRPAGYAAMVGIWTGAVSHSLMAAAGLSAILAASSLAFSAVKWAGAAYLIWIGIQALMSKGDGLVPSGQSGYRRLGAIYRQGVIISTLNPKVAIFYLAFLPQFVVEGAGPVWAQLFLHGMLIIITQALVEFPLVLAGSRLSEAMKRRPGISQWFERVLGTVFVALGLRLALAER